MSDNPGESGFEPDDEVQSLFSNWLAGYPDQPALRATEEGLFCSVLLVGARSSQLAWPLFDEETKNQGGAADPIHGYAVFVWKGGRIRGLQLHITLTLLGPDPFEGAQGTFALAQGLATASAVVCTGGESAATRRAIVDHHRGALYAYGSEEQLGPLERAPQVSVVRPFDLDEAGFWKEVFSNVLREAGGS